MGLVAISGIFYPIQQLRGWLQGVAQVFPIYWLGSGMRSALLPDRPRRVEIGGIVAAPRDRRLVLGAWAVVGLVVAPMVLRRMARRRVGLAASRPPRAGSAAVGPEVSDE